MVDQPNYTQVPNQFFDDRMKELSPNAFKVLMVICRKTFGFHKPGLVDRVSNSQLMEMSGIKSYETLYDAVGELGEDVTKTVEGKAIYYRVNVTATVSQSYGNRNIEVDNPTETVHTKEIRVKQTSLKKDTAIAVSTSDTLYSGLQKAFLSKNDNKFSNYGKEGRAIHSLISRAKERMPDDPTTLLRNMLASFWKLKNNDTSARGFWRGQPFLPSSLSPLWDRVLETMRKEEVDPEIARLIKGGQ